MLHCATAASGLTCCRACARLLIHTATTTTRCKSQDHCSIVRGQTPSPPPIRESKIKHQCFFCELFLIWGRRVLFAHSTRLIVFFSGLAGLPRLHEHLQRLMVPVQMYTTPWCMCLFCTTLPARPALPRSWDFLKSSLPNSNEIFCVLNRQRGLTLARPTAAPTATSSTYV